MATSSLFLITFCYYRYLPERQPSQPIVSSLCFPFRSELRTHTKPPNDSPCAATTQEKAREWLSLPAIPQMDDQASLLTQLSNWSQQAVPAPGYSILCSIEFFSPGLALSDSTLASSLPTLCAKYLCILFVQAPGTSHETRAEKKKDLFAQMKTDHP